jgi:flagellar basal body-associated protein FliL
MMTQWVPQPVLAVIIIISLFALLCVTISLIYDWFKDNSKNNSKDMEPDKSPWSLGDAVKFGFGFGMGMFLWGVFLIVVIFFFLTGGMSTISNFFSPSNTPVNGASGQYNVNNLGGGTGF